MAGGYGARHRATRCACTSTRLREAQAAGRRGRRRWNNAAHERTFRRTEASRRQPDAARAPTATSARSRRAGWTTTSTATSTTSSTTACFDSAVNRYLIEAGVLDIRAGGVIGLVVETHCNYFAPLAFPQPIDAGLRVAQHRHVERALRDRPVRRRRAAGGRQRPLRARLCRSRVAPPDCRCRPRFIARTARPAVTAPASDSAAVDAAITSRRSMRAFLPTPVPRADDRGHPRRSRRARPRAPTPSRGSVYVLTGDAKASLSRQLRAAYDDPAERARHTEEYAYYPTEWVLALHRPAPQGRLGPVRPARHRQDRQGRACMRSIGATTISSARRSA